MKNPEAKKLEDVEAVLPNGLLAFITRHVLSGFTGIQPDLVDSYWEYFNQLVGIESFFAPYVADSWRLI